MFRSPTSPPRSPVPPSSFPSGLHPSRDDHSRNRVETNARRTSRVDMNFEQALQASGTVVIKEGIDVDALGQDLNPPGQRHFPHLPPPVRPDPSMIQSTATPNVAALLHPHNSKRHPRHPPHDLLLLGPHPHLLHLTTSFMTPKTQNIKLGAALCTGLRAPQAAQILPPLSARRNSEEAYSRPAKIDVRRPPRPYLQVHTHPLTFLLDPATHLLPRPLDILSQLSRHLPC
jgi:hypothetical protein